MSYSSYSGYPNFQDPLAGNSADGTFQPFQLFAGESDIVTTDETIAQFGKLPQFLVMGRRADGKLVPLVPFAQDAAGPVAAKATATFTAVPAVNDTITINGIVVTFIASNAVPVGNQVPVGATAALTAEALAEYLFDNPAVFSDEIEVDYNANSAIVTLVAATPGTGGNAYTLTKSSSAITVSGATFAGGSATGAEALPESRPVSVLAQPIDTTNGDVQGPVYLDGVFNASALLWPEGITTLAQMKQITDGCRFSVKALK